MRSKMSTMSNRICALVLCLFAPYTSYGHEINEKLRPPGVPLNAYWVGGSDGGNYYDCKILKVERLAQCSIYDDEDGSIEFKGGFKLEGWEVLKYSSEIEFYKDIDFFDGSSLSLVTGSSKRPE